MVTPEKLNLVARAKVGAGETAMFRLHAKRAIILD